MDIFAKICDVIHELVGVPASEITPDSTPDELKLDSLDLEELVLSLEEEFDVIIPDESIDTLNDLVIRVSAA